MKLFSFYWIQYIKLVKCDQIFFLFLHVCTIISDNICLLSNQRLWNWKNYREFLHRENRLNFFSYFLRQWKRISRLPLYLFWFSIFQYLRVERLTTVFLLRANGLLRAIEKSITRENQWIVLISCSFLVSHFLWSL